MIGAPIPDGAEVSHDALRGFWRKSTDRRFATPHPRPTAMARSPLRGSLVIKGKRRAIKIVSLRGLSEVVSDRADRYRPKAGNAVVLHRAEGHCQGRVWSSGDKVRPGMVL